MEVPAVLKWGSQRRGVLSEHPAILQANAVAGLWRSRLML
jgi:hypothetical protein